MVNTIASDTAVTFGQIIGNSEKMASLFSIMEKLLDNDSTVLILGESGVGKELVAKALHAMGCGKDGEMVVVHCGAIPHELLESELFGHEKGSFTGAIRTRIGKFELAAKGTIFLDEIGDMSPQLQVKLLRILQEKQFERVGGNRPIGSDARVVAATNRDLEKEVFEGRFREDLFYRLNVIPLSVPPLRERHGDIPILANKFVERLNRKKSRNIQGFSPETIGFLEGYAWPGNVRELEHVIERIVVLKGEGFITPSDLPKNILAKQENDRQLEFDMLLVGGVEEDKAEERFSPVSLGKLPDSGIDLKAEVDKFETKLILSALEKSNGVKNKAAKLLGLNRTTLVEKLKKRGM